ncbi:MAG: YbaB/EbfC family nucleoid-associated protein [Nitrospirota bacterium]|nr:YbaB/EbfC family nucleoid-associated protein [Nitrospirota bacterium]
MIPKHMMGNIMKQAQALQDKMAKTQEEIAARTVEASSGGGMVTATVNGRGEMVGLAVDPSVLEGGDVEMLQDLVVAAVSEAQRRAKEYMAQEMAKVTGGMNIPGLF